MPRLPMPDILSVWNDSRRSVWAHQWRPETGTLALIGDVAIETTFPKWFIARVHTYGVRHLEFRQCAGRAGSLTRLFDIPETVAKLTIQDMYDLKVIPKLPRNLLCLQIEGAGIDRLPALPCTMERLIITWCNRLRYIPTLPDMIPSGLTYTFWHPQLHIRVGVHLNTLSVGFDSVTYPSDRRKLLQYRAAVRLQRWWRMARWMRARRPRRRQCIM